MKLGVPIRAYSQRQLPCPAEPLRGWGLEVWHWARVRHGTKTEKFIEGL